MPVAIPTSKAMTPRTVPMPLLTRWQRPGPNGHGTAGRNGHHGGAGFPPADVPEAELLLARARVPMGFRAAGVACGLKARGRAGKPPLDLAVVVSERRASTAGVFTTNRFAAAPIVVCREHLDRSMGQARAVVVNSGCANAATG